MNNLMIIRRFKYSQFDTGWCVVNDDGEVQAFFEDIEGDDSAEGIDLAFKAAQEWVSCAA